MSRKTDTRGLTAELLLSKMIVNKGYSPSDLANRTNYRVADVRVLLERMAQNEQLVTRKRDARKEAYYLNQPDPDAQPTNFGDFEVAQPLQTHRIDGVISGYDAEIARRMSLCMTVRR
jgi:hypothetical protein